MTGGQDDPTILAFGAKEFEEWLDATGDTGVELSWWAGTLDTYEAADGSSSGNDEHGADWPWPWGALGLNPWLTLAMGLISFASEGLCAHHRPPPPPPHPPPPAPPPPARAPPPPWSLFRGIKRSEASPSCLVTDGATSFGPAITFNVGWQLCYMLGLSDGTLTTVAINMTVMEIASACLQIILLRNSIDPWLAAAVSLPCIVCTYIGQELMIRLDGPGLKISLSGILFFMTAYRVYARCGTGKGTEDRPVPPGLDLTNLRTILSIFFWFSVAGLMGGITSIGGPPMMLFVSIHADEIDLRTWRGSNAVLRLLLNLARAGVFIQAGRFALNRSWPLDLGMVAGGWCGLLCGNACAHLFRDANALHWWMVSFLFYASLLMAAAAAGAKVQRQASLAVGCMACLTAVGAGIRQLCTKPAQTRFRDRATPELHQPLVDEALDAVDSSTGFTSSSGHFDKR